MKRWRNVQRVIILALLVCGASRQSSAQISKAAHTKLKGLMHEYWYDDWKSATTNSNKIMYSNSMNMCDSIFSSNKVDLNFRDWILKKNAGQHNRFTEEQMQWLRMIKDHIATSIHLDADDLDYTPFDAQQ